MKMENKASVDIRLRVSSRPNNMGEEASAVKASFATMSGDTTDDKGGLMNDRMAKTCWVSRQVSRTAGFISSPRMIADIVKRSPSVAIVPVAIMLLCIGLGVFGACMVRAALARGCSDDRGDTGVRWNVINQGHVMTTHARMTA